MFDIRVFYKPHLRCKAWRDEYGNKCFERILRDEVETWCQENCKGAWAVVATSWAGADNDEVRFPISEPSGPCFRIFAAYCLRFTEARDAVLFKMFWK